MLTAWCARCGTTTERHKNGRCAPCRRASRRGSYYRHLPARRKRAERVGIPWHPRRAWCFIKPADLWRWLALHPSIAAACRSIGKCSGVAWLWLNRGVVPHPRTQLAIAQQLEEATRA